MQVVAANNEATFEGYVNDRFASMEEATEVVVLYAEMLYEQMVDHVGSHELDEEGTPDDNLWH
tara:strand:+ start:575 stop:763 length:189 start_codon:yes stop_codon:yes gene_type:complete